MARDLLARSLEVIGVDQKVWLSQESGGFGQNATGGQLPVAAGAIEHITINPVFDIPREDSASRSGRSVTFRLSGKKTVEISVEAWIIPGIPDGLGNPTLPPLHPVFLSAFGDVDLSDPTKIVYKLSRLNDKSYRILEEATHYTRLATGCVADSLTFALPGDGKAQITSEGFGQDVFFSGESKLSQDLTGAAVAASLVLQDLTYTSVALDSSGNLVTITYSTGGTQGAEVVTVVGNDIDIQIEDGVSTATNIETAYNLVAAAVALATVAVSGVGGDPQIAATIQNLSGGLADDEMKVGTDEGQRFEQNGVIDVIAGSDGNTASDSARTIAAVGTGVNKDIIRVSGGALATASTNDFVVGHAPAVFNPVSSENALLGLKGSVSFAGFTGTDCEITSAEISLANNYTKKDFIYGTSQLCGFLPDKRREVNVKIEMIMNRDNLTFFARNKKFIAEDVTILLEPQDIPAPSFTSGVGRTFEFKMPKVEFNIPPIEQPADSFVTLSLEGKALALDSDNLDSEFTLTIR